MPKKPISSAVEREGVNFTRSIVEAANWEEIREEIRKYGDTIPINA
jgi:hypothetical protein